MKILKDSYIVAMDQRYESSTTKAGIITLNAAYVNDEDEGRHISKRVYGTVVQCPETFSDTVVSLVDIGYPPAHGYVGHDLIQAKSNQGMSLRALPTYYPSTFEGFETITMEDVAKKTNIEVGDIVYFDYNVTEPENCLGKNAAGHEIYRVQVDMIYVAIKNGNIEMQGGWVLVEPDMETWEEIQTPSGIYKKPSPEAKYLLGFVRHMQPREDLSIGDRIMYMHDADAPMKVEGVDYYCMNRNEIICRVS
jgi:co-chaperonin GroES (HSP10)